MSRIIAACRSPIAPRGGALASYLPHELAAPVIRDLLARGGIAPDQVGEVIMANSLGAGGNPARIAALAAGLPERVAGLSLDRQCVGGLDAILLGDALIRAGLHDIVIAGGAESYSRRPHRMHRYSDGREPEAYEQAPFTPWPNRDPDMAQAADQLADDLGIPRQTQDDWAQASHANALAARADLAREITPLAGLTHDSFTRTLSPRHCRMAKPVCGSITAANMAVAADGAAFVLMVSERVTHQHPGLRVLGGQTRGADPTQPGLAPVPAIKATLSAAQLSPTDLSAIELMEAFAIQAIACQQGAQLPPARINRKGGALARGHPIGASGAVLAARLFHDLSNAATEGTGLAAIAAAGGLGTALLLGR